MAGLCALGFALRLWYAHWPLWVDEIWSLKDLGPIRHFWQILWGISQDNNHYLYSIYLFFAWPVSHNEIWLRAPSIAAGVAAIPIMARLAGRDRVAALAAAAMTAISTLLVIYSAQARGYALAVLLWIVAYRELEKAMEKASGARWRFALAIGVAAFCHLVTFAVAVLFGLAAICEFLVRERDLVRAIRRSVQLFWPALAGLAPIFLCLVAGTVEMGGFIVNFVRPYAPALAFAGFSQMIVATLAGATAPVLVAAAMPLVAVGAFVVLREPAISRFRRISYAVMLFGFPALVFVAKPPNSHLPRYYLISAVFLILAAADLFAILWRKSGAWRAAAAAVLALLAIGNLNAMVAAKEANVAAWPEALSVIAASPSHRVGTNFDFNIREFVAYYNRFAGKPLQLTGSGFRCDNAPEWYIVESDTAAEPAMIGVDARRQDGGHCTLQYALRSTYGASTFFESRWLLYRAAAPRGTPSPSPGLTRGLRGEGSGEGRVDSPSEASLPPPHPNLLPASGEKGQPAVRSIAEGSNDGPHGRFARDGN